MRNDLLVKIAAKLQDAHEALELIQGVQSNGLRSQALAEIAPKHKDDREALATAREIQDNRYRETALEGIVLTTIRGLSNRRRVHLLSDLSSLAPLMAKLGGDEALLETIQAIEDVGRWWP